MRVKNWHKFQHFKDRRPPWIKLYRDILDDREWHALEPAAAKALVMFWLIASENDGYLPGAAELAFRIRLDVQDVDRILTEIMRAGFIFDSDATDDETKDDLTPAQRIAKQNGYGSRYITDAVKRDVMLRDEAKCTACGAADNLEFDHKHPVSKGGTSETENIQLLCRPCNRRKRARLSYDKRSAAAATGAAKDSAERSLETEGERETEKITLTTPSGSSTEYSAEFEQAWAVLPKREGDNPKKPAFACWKARLGAGRTAEEMIAGAQRYAQFCREKGKVGTEFVMQAKRFFGATEPFLQAWSAAPGAGGFDPFAGCSP